MVFWIAILCGALFVWLAIRLGFYETWLLFFNIIVSLYVAVFLTPLLLEFAPAPEGAASYRVALGLLVLAGGCFALLHGLSYVLLTGQFHLPFPRVFDIVLAGLLGFAAGFLVLSFAALVLTTTPVSEHKIVRTLGLDRQAQWMNLAGIAWCCDRIHSVAGFGGDAHPTRAAVDRLLNTSDGLRQGDKDVVDANEPPAISPSTPSSPETPKDGPAKARLGRRTIPTDAFPE